MERWTVVMLCVWTVEVCQSRQSVVTSQRMLANSVREQCARLDSRVGQLQLEEEDWKVWMK